MKKFLQLFLVFLLVAGFGLFNYLVYLDKVIQEKLHGRLWEIPARVYARPLEIFTGIRLDIDDLVLELQALGYTEITDKTNISPGRFSRIKNKISFVTRGFKFTDGSEVSKLVNIEFTGNSVTKLATEDNINIPLLRLEPLFLGGFYPKHNEDRILIELEEVPKLIKQTLIEVEDHDFYKHKGISIKGILRAIFVNISQGKLTQGASTISQQLVKNLFLSNEKTIARKIVEALMTIITEFRISKDNILESYINEVYFGQDKDRAIHGFALAAQYFFAKPLEELTVPQIATLVGLVKGPSVYNPKTHMENAIARRNIVLKIMLDSNLITQNLYETSKAEVIELAKINQLTNTRYPAALDLVRRQLKSEYSDEDLTQEGLQIFTSFDPILQLKLENTIIKKLPELAIKNRKNQELQAASITVRHSTGEILAIVADKNPKFMGLNRVIDIRRPIGSLIKPAIYLTALQDPEQYTLMTKLIDEPITIESAGSKPWAPKNYDNKVHGSVFLYEALTKSYNLSTVRLGVNVGIANVISTLKILGVKDTLTPYPSLLLGAIDLSPLAVAQMYQTIANNGFNIPLRSIRTVLTHDNKPFKHYHYDIEQYTNPSAIYLLQFILQKVMTEGTGAYSYRFIPNSIALAGKTGTTNDNRDSWFAGFSDDITSVVWLGNDDNSVTSLTGSTGALPIWTEFMHNIKPISLNLVKPSNITFEYVNKYDGALTSPNCAGSIMVPFIEGSQFNLEKDSCRILQDSDIW